MKLVKKTLLFWINGDSKRVSLTFEEMLKYDGAYCDRIIRKFASDCTHKIKKIHGNIMEEDDFYNEGLLRAHYCFNMYEADKSFAIYLQNGLNQLWLDYTKNVFAKKRKSEDEVVSFDSELDNGTYLKDAEGNFDYNFNRMELKEDISNALSKLTNEERSIVGFLVNEEKTKKILAAELKISRPTLDTRIELVKKKMMHLLPEYLSC